ncbi:unnamed protein product [Prorocentrum cordatum]|uniref:Nudix hydrolase domain-containing protein n=1 Tax=Prorocentrum cordatum TaxID=2364126 RepID=A0ABN9VQ20_9DINO|nr:unnamed protein product [Polarella glacialis]
MEARTVDGVIAISDAPDSYSRLIWLREEEEGAAALVRRRRGGLMLAAPGGSILETELAASQQEEDHALGPFVRARVRGAGLANPASALATVSFEILLVDVEEGVLTELVPEAVYYEDGQHAQRVLRHFTPRARHWPHGRTVLEESSRAFRSQFGEEAFAEFFTAGEEEAESAVIVGGSSEQPAEEEAAEVAGVLRDGFAESDGPLEPPPQRAGRPPPLQRPPQPAPPRAAPPGGPLARAAAGEVAAAPLLGSGGALAGRSPPTAFGVAPPPAPSAFGRPAPPPGPPSRSGAADFESPAAWQAVLGRHGAPPGPELRGLRTTAAPAGAFPGTGEDFAGEGEDDAAGGGTEMERFAAALMGAARAFSQRGEEGGAGGNGDLMGLGGGNVGAGVRGTAHREALIAARRTSPGSFSRSLMEAMAAQGRSSRQPRGVAYDPPEPRLWLERTGGWSEFTPGSPNTVRDLALIAWQVADIVDRLWMNQIAEAADSAALLLMGLDQARIDGGRLDMMWLYQFERDPPASLFARGGQSAVGTRQFSSLANPRWSTVNLAYLRELDLLETRRSELQRPQGRTPVPRARGAPEQPQPEGAGVIGPGGGAAEAGAKPRPPRRRPKPASPA